MTAIIGVLNKTAVALAADSAATVSGGSVSKVYNNAHKIFNLSSCYPVGISIYNSAEFMGIPWETLIKMYRKELGTKPFPNLFDYADDFILFINKLKSNINAEDIKAYLSYTITNIVPIIREESVTEFQDKFPDVSTIDVNIEFNSILLDHINVYISSFKQQETLDEFSDYTIDMFFTAHTMHVENLLASLFDPKAGITLLDNTIAGFKELFYLNIVKAVFNNPFSGIIITGFGENDVFPKLRSYHIGGIIDQRLKFKVGEDVIISNQNPSTITPFAQIDIISTFLKGIDPFIISNIITGLQTILDSYNVDIKNAVPVGIDTTTIDAIINKAPEIIAKFEEIINNICNERNLYPILGTIGTLSKEDLAEMAESLINLTYLKRRVSFEQESVGGPVDVALITKGDGFVWIKRKHYFKPELNLNYLSSVLNQRNP